MVVAYSFYPPWRSHVRMRIMLENEKSIAFMEVK